MTHLRRHKARIFAAATTVGIVAAIAAAALLQDATGGSSGTIKALSAVTFQAGPVPGDAPLEPGQFAPASVRIHTPEAMPGLEIYELQDVAGDPFNVEGIGPVTGSLVLNARPLATPVPVPVGAGDHDVRIPQAFFAPDQIPLDWRGRNFTKQIRLRFRAP